MTSGLEFAQRLPGAVGAFGLGDLDDAEGLQDGDDELAHVGVVVHDEHPQPVKTVFTHAPAPVCSPRSELTVCHLADLILNFRERCNLGAQGAPWHQGRVYNLEG